MSEEQQKLKVDGVQLVSGALTAVTSALLLSTVGVAGTLIGVAVGSVVGTLGNAVYGHYLRLSRQRVTAAKVLAEAQLRSAPGPVDPEAAEQAQEEAEERARRVPWREVLRGLPWSRILKVTTAAFVLVLGAILAFELVTGRALSTFTGGTDEPRRTSIPGVGSPEPRDRQPEQRPPGDQPDAPEEGTTEAPESTTGPSPTPTESVPAPAPIDPTVAPEPEVTPPAPAETPTSP